MKRTIAIVATLALLALGGQAFAEICTIDAVPAATLLLPYFEVDFTTEDDQQAITTIFSINNASSTPAIAHVVLWTNISIPTIDFDVYLTGYDVQPVNLRALFRDGELPRTAAPDQDPDDDISPHEGDFSDNPAWDDAAGAMLDLNSACDNTFPFGSPALTAGLISRIQNGHTGQPIFGDTCLGLDVGKTTTVNGVTVPLAIGYITVDSVNVCSIAFPQDANYFIDGGTGVANNRNILWGDYYIIDPANNAAYGDNLVHVEADATEIGPNGEEGGFSFYSRFTNASDGRDNREPLPNAWGIRYITGGQFDGGTRLAVWRDSRVNPTGAGVDCGDKDYTSLEEGQVVAFNEREDAVELCERGGNISPQPGDFPCFPDEINWTEVGGDVLDPPFNNGWLYLNLDIADAPAPLASVSQSWVTGVFTALGRYEVGFPGIQLWNACVDPDEPTNPWAPRIDGVIFQQQ